MTLKQFGFLAAGVILAFISYKLPLPFIFTWPLTVLFAIGGFAFAFVPIEERPMDVWVLSFLKNVYNPTIFHWERTAPTPEPVTPTAPAAKPAQVTQPQTTPQMSQPTKTQAAPASTIQQLFTPVVAQPIMETKPKKDFFSWLDDLFSPKTHITPAFVQTQPQQTRPQPPETPPSLFTQTVTPQPQTPLPLKPTPPIEKPQKTPAEKEQDLEILKLELEALSRQLKEKKQVEGRFSDLQKQLSELMTERQRMEKELIQLKQQQMQGAVPPRYARPVGVVEFKKSNEPTVKLMGTDAAIRAGIPKLTTFPNVVTGIVRDFDNNILPGVLVTVKDKEAIPLRALKTNKLGQFAASTPLPNGVYFVEVEDPRNRYTFDRVQITLNGSLMPALLIVAKSKRQLEREELSKQIFGTPNAST